MSYQNGRIRSEVYESVMSHPRLVGVVGSSSLPYHYAEHVGQIVDDLLGHILLVFVSLCAMLHHY